MRFPSNLFRCAPALAVLLCGGCGNDTGGLAVETDEPLYREGQQLEKQGRTKEALASYLRLISRRGDDAPESHLEAGLIELEEIKDPIAAIYHFRRFLELEPKSPLAGRVHDQIDRARREFAATLPAQHWENLGAAGDLPEKVAQLESENERLKAEIAALRGSVVNPPRPAPAEQAPRPSFSIPVASADPPLVPVGSEPAEGPPAAGRTEGPAPRLKGTAAARPASPAAAHPGRTHVVSRKETLYSLAQKYYGSGARWRDILNANRDRLSGEHPGLVVGMELRIP